MSTWMETEYGTPEEKTRIVLGLMAAHGVERIEAFYSGGNDEGGIDYIDEVKNVAGEPVEIPGLADYDHPLHGALAELLSTKFGTWAGEWSASGTLVVDAKEKRAWTEGSMTVDQSDEDPLNVNLGGS